LPVILILRCRQSIPLTTEVQKGYLFVRIDPVLPECEPKADIIISPETCDANFFDLEILIRLDLLRRDAPADMEFEAVPMIVTSAHFGSFTSKDYSTEERPVNRS
jgi:hypothetical protein